MCQAPLPASRGASHERGAGARGGGLRALFLTWDGPQQSYLESLFFPIFAALRERDIEIQVLQLTWADAARLSPVRAAANRFGIVYQSRHVPQALRKLALPAVVAYGAVAALSQMKRAGIGTLFPRSLIPMSMALTALKARPELDLVFDADGFMADERIDFGGWKASGSAYRVLRAVEASGARRARALICRTEKAREVLVERAGTDKAATRRKTFVAPNGKDEAVFAPRSAEERGQTRDRHGIGRDAPWVVYVGSIGPQYCPELMLESFARILEQRPDARFSCFTFQHTQVRDLLQQRGRLQHAVQVASVSPREIPELLAACDLGIALRRQVFSQSGVSPIKVAEYLLSGVPVVATPVGDLQEQLGASPAALLVDEAAPGAASQIATWFVEQVLPERERHRIEARCLGQRWFEISSCVDTYARAMAHDT